MSAVSPRPFLVGGYLKHDGSRENTPARRKYVPRVGGLPLMVWKLDVGEKQSGWIELPRERDGGTEGYIIAPEHPFFFFIRNSLFGARPPSLLPLRLAFSVLPIPISDLVDPRASPSFLEILVVCLVTGNWELRINKTISPVLPFKIAFLLKKILSRTANSNVNRPGKRIYIYSLFLHSFLPILLSSVPFCRILPGTFYAYSCVLLFPMLISLHSSVLFRSLFLLLYILTPLFRIECRMWV